MATEPARRLFTVGEYHRMAETGILHPDDRVELLDGEIVEMTPIGPPHAFSVDRLALLFIERLGRRAVVRVQNPVVLDDHTEPQPDLSVCRPTDDGYRTAHPRPGDLLLVIEVADTTAAWDRGEKIRRYARADVPESWLVDVNARRIEAYGEPGPDGYAVCEVFAPGQKLSPSAFPDMSLPVDEIVG